jgi:hypothetical protein
MLWARPQSCTGMMPMEQAMSLIPDEPEDKN